MASIQASKDKNIILAYHSFPVKPCVDGFMAAIISTFIYEDLNLAFVPYWRTDECFQNIEYAITKMGYKNTSLVYVDCTPELENEASFLNENLDKFDCVKVFDHHPKSENSPVEQLIGREGFDYYFDPDNCAAVIMYKYLLLEKKQHLKLDDILKIIQFSEYEAMNPRLAGQEEAEEIAHKIFENVKAQSIASNSYLASIKEKDMELYYILDLILAKEKENFVFDKKSSLEKQTNDFQRLKSKYLARVDLIVSGNGGESFADQKLLEYLDLIEEMNNKLDKGWVSKAKKIGEKTCDVLVISINIFTYGRSLEPYVRKRIASVGAQYAVLMNIPTKIKENKLSYYFSLRRLNENYNARELAKFCMEITGSKIGGGHPWASGVSLNEEQQQKFMKEFQ